MAFLSRARTGAVSVALNLVLAATPATPSPVPDGEWVTVSDTSLEVLPGSALDFSAITSPLPGQRMTIAGDRLTFGGQDIPINCATLAPGYSETPLSGFPDHDTATRYAVQLRRHGYNLIRFHFTDALLMQGSNRDFTFDPQQLDRFQFFQNELRKQGIHWLVDLMASRNAGYGTDPSQRWSNLHDMLVRVFVDPAAFQHWQQLARTILTTRNPYSGFTLASDPHTAALVMVNEGDLNMQAAIHPGPGGRFPAGLQASYAAWLTQHGQDPTAASQLPKVGERSQQDEQFQHFISDRQVMVSRQMQQTIREIGYDGPVTQFANWEQINMIPSRRELPMVDAHGYDQVPVQLTPGQVDKPVSSLPDGASYMQQIASTRFFGRPFIVTEHDQPFWNPYRYESGLVAPAIASLQGWNFICRHADGPIDLAYDGKGLRKQAIAPDGGGLDPVARAGETLTALLLARREIGPARGAVAIAIDDAAALRNGGVDALPADVTIAMWMARIGIADQRSGPLPGALRVDPAALSQGRLALHSTGSAMIAALRGAGQLPGDNPSTADGASLVGDGGMVVLHGAARQLAVTTQYTSAAAFAAVTAPIVLGPVRIAQADGPALVALSTLDKVPLANSGRILVILASDARNTGMRVAADGTLLVAGALPVQLRRVRATVDIAVPAGNWTLTPLRLNGAPGQSLGLSGTGNHLRVPLDTAMDPHNPTTFFLLQRR